MMEIQLNRLINEDYNTILRKAVQEWQKNIHLTYSPHTNLRTLLSNESGPYIKAEGKYGPLNFINTCVLDSLLVCLHTSCLKYKHIWSFLYSEHTFLVLMASMDVRNFDYAKALWWRELQACGGRFHLRDGVVDMMSNPMEHLPLFANLLCPNERFSFVHEETKSIFQHLGNVMVLGRNCILATIKRENVKPEQRITDIYNRTFELQFMLCSSSTHMMACVLLEDRWHLYDNESQHFELFDHSLHAKFEVKLVGYVNTTKEDPTNGYHSKEDGVQTRCESDVDLTEGGGDPHGDSIVSATYHINANVKLYLCFS